MLKVKPQLKVLQVPPGLVELGQEQALVLELEPVLEPELQQVLAQRQERRPLPV